MQPRPFPNNPFAGAYNPAFPVPDGAVAGTFNAFGWLRELINSGLGQSINDLDYASTIGSGYYV